MNILTIDLEEWFHILNNPSTDNESSWDNFEFRLRENLDRVLNLLNDSDNIATFFCLGWVARKYPDIVKEISSLGHEIGSHSNAHQLIDRHDRNFFRNDLYNPIKKFSAVLNLILKFNSKIKILVNLQIIRITQIIQIPINIRFITAFMDG